MENEISVKQDSSAQDFFLYLVTFLSLTFTAIGGGSVLFGFIDKFTGSNKDKMVFSFDQSGVRFGIAAIFIAAPIFFILSYLITKRISTKMTSLDSVVRKWLTYIVLFFAAATTIGDLITLVVNFLGGDFTASFLLKVLVILLIAGSIFGYYFWDMHRTEVVSKKNKPVFIAAVLAALMIFIGGFFIIDSPTVSKQKNIDQKTVNQLQSVDGSIQSYFDGTGKLPNAIDELKQTKFSVSIDEIKGFSYKVKNNLAYELCSDFSRSNMSDGRTMYDYSSIFDWKHEAGNFCFARTVLKKADNQPQTIK